MSGRTRDPARGATTGRDTRLPYYAGLDGLRGLAVAAVLLFHGDVFGASGGYLGVSTFFVLSGYLITSLLLVEQERAGRVRLADFWARRFRRLLPAAFLGILLAAAYSLDEADAAQLARLRGDGLSALAYVANWRFMLTGLGYEDLFGRPSPLQHYWSLSIEEQFYLVFPPLIALSMSAGGGDRKWAIRAVALAIVCSSGLMAWLFTPETSTARIYYGSDTRAAEPLLGALFALRYTRGGQTRVGSATALQIAAAACLGLIALAWSGATLHSPWVFRGGLLLHGLLNLVVIGAIVAGGPIDRVLGWGPLRFLGRISYGVYLYHWPIFQWIGARFGDESSSLVFWVGTAITLPVATASFYWVEQPIRQGRWLQGWRSPVTGMAGAGLAVVALLYVTHDPPEPWFFQGVVNRTPAMPEVWDDGDQARLLVVGDSITKSLGRGLARRGGDHGTTVWNVAVMGCGLARRGEAVYLRGIRHDDSTCTAWSDWWPVQLARFEPHYVVIAGGPWDVVERKLPEWTDFRGPGDPVFDDWLVSEYVEAVDTLSADGARVIWLTTPCMAPRNRSVSLDEDSFSSKATLYLNQRIVPRVLEARPARMRVIDLFGRVCEGDSMIQDIGGRESLRPDGVHFSLTGADWVADWLLPQIREVGP